VPKEEKKPGTKVKINPKIIAEFEKEGIPLGYDSPEEYYNDFYGPMLKDGGMLKKAKDMSVKHEGMESMADEAKETRLEKKGYVETKSGKMKKVKKASLGALIGIGADSLLKNSETARSLTKNLGIGGKLLGSYYDKKADSKDKTTGAEQTKQVTAKREGGMVRGGRAEIKGTRPAKLT
jgi:hypothetical protein